MEPTTRIWEIWRHVPLCIGLRTREEFKTAMGKMGCMIGMWGGLMIDSSAFAVADSQADVPLILVPQEELGFRHVSPLRALTLGQGLGLRPCPFEAALQLRMRWLDQPLNQIVIVITEPISIGRGHNPHMFELANDARGLAIRGTYDDLDVAPEPSTSYVFTK